METSSKSKTDYLDAQRAWGEAFDSAAGAEIWEVLRKIGDSLETLAGSRATIATMTALRNELLRRDGSFDFKDEGQPGRWRQVWDNNDIDGIDAYSPEVDCIYAAQKLTSLHAYGVGGCAPLFYFPDPKTEEEIDTDILRLLSWGERALMEVSRFSTEGDSSFCEDIKRTFAAASGRWKLDKTGIALTVLELASLSGVAEKTVRNVLSGSETTRDEEGRPPIKWAIAWLQNQKEFKESTWRGRFSSLQAQESKTAPETIINPLFVPAASDGSLFTPSLKRASGFTIGPKTAEQNIDDYDEALKILSQMTTPAWRRPNKNGHWGIVVAKEWRRISREEMGDGQ